MSLIDKASLIQIPSGYKSTKLYSIEPTNGDGDFTFARSSSATRVNSEGLIEEMSANVPRLDYSGGASCASLLLEPQRTNQLIYSEQFDNAAWTKINSTITANATTSPDGTLSADIIARAGVGSRVRQDRSSILPTNQSSFSLYAKKYSNNNGLIIRIEDASSTTNYFGATVDLELNTISGFTNGNGVLSFSSIEDVGNGWHRINLSGIPNISGTITRVAIYTTTATIGEGVYIWGAQLEQGSYPTSYIPTSGSTVTRTADVCNNAGTSATFNDSEGVLFAEIAALANDGRIALNDGTTNNNVRLVYNSSLNRIEGIVYNGANQAFLNYTLPLVNSFYKIAFKYKASDFSLYVNGLEVDNQIGSGVTFPDNTLSQIDFDAGNGLVPFYGNTKQLMVFNEALSDEELATLTTL